ncbi:MAG: hypothetical protein WC108_01680 [Bacteroidales bacterium]|nr:hypothetical protein [Dysgonamonadaceae bacterium]
MTPEIASRIYGIISKTSYVKLFEKIQKKSVEYAHIRAEFALADRETQIEMDPSRTIVHNALIDCIKILARNMGAAGEDVEWYRLLLKGDRYEIGKFACWVHWYLSDEA